MKFGIRTPSIKGRISARLSPARYVRHSLGLKAPRGFGWLTNPQKALYNRIYNRTTVSVDRLFQSPGRRRHQGNSESEVDATLGMLLFLLIGAGAFIGYCFLIAVTTPGY